MSTRLYFYLDDERANPDPNRYQLVKTAPELIEILKKLGNNLSHVTVDLDHDLGPNCDIEKVGTGYDVLLYLEEMVYTQKDFHPPRIKIHTANASARPKMWQAADSITKKYLENQKNI